MKFVVVVPSVAIEIDVDGGSGVRRREVTVYDGDDLEQTTRRAIYRDCRIGEIRVAEGDVGIEADHAHDGYILESERRAGALGV